jgi:hypothetical protein
MADGEVGNKLDDGKARFDLMPPLAVREFVEVLTIGAKKYGPENWRHVKDRRRRYFAACLRHVWAWWIGEGFDPETQRSHLAHAMCCLAFLLEDDLGGTQEKA